MPIYEIEGVAPRIDADAFVHPDAVVIGDVTIGPESSVWPGAVLRGDYGTITVGARSSIQDGTVVHAGPGFPTRPTWGPSSTATCWSTCPRTKSGPTASWSS